MTAKKPRTPKFRHHKGSGQGFVELNGRRIYLGVYGRPETRAKYHQAVAEWEANGRRVPVAPDDLTIVELVAAFVHHAETYYRKADGTPTSEIVDVKLAMRPVKELYGRQPVSEFGPRALKACRQWFIDRDCARTYINRHADRIKRMVKWAVAEEMVPASAYHGLQAVAGLKRGRTDARETDPVRPVPVAHVDAVKPHVSRQVWAMIQLQRHTAARPGEIVRLRAVDFTDTAGKVWLATLSEHKTAHHGHTRTLYFGPRAIEVVRPFMAGRPIDAYMFDPREANREMAQRGAHCKRRPKQKLNERKTERRIGDSYSRDSYRRAVHRACDLANVPQWSPARLRHNAATMIRRDFGLEAAQLLCGHARADVTQVYAEVNRAKAVEVAAKVG